MKSYIPKGGQDDDDPDENTTTCAECGLDFPDEEMSPLPEGGELCPRCVKQKKD